MTIAADWQLSLAGHMAMGNVQRPRPTRRLGDLRLAALNGRGDGAHWPGSVYQDRERPQTLLVLGKTVQSCMLM
jgi:hypothetical protein